MSHIHLPDGTMPAPWWIAGLVVMALILMLSIRSISTQQARMKIPFLGAMAALMLVTMSVPLGPLPFHLNLTVLTGIVAGPALGFVTVSIVNVLLSFLGHGGLTTIGLNTMITGLEVSLGWWVFHRLLKNRSLTSRAVLAPLVTLLISISLTVGLLGVSTGTWAAALPHDEHGHEVVATGSSPAESPSLFEAMGGVEFLGMAGMGA
ncbi:MAG: energy-coupling factor ABC transporter permease, partial [Bacillota bacterium]